MQSPKCLRRLAARHRVLHARPRGLVLRWTANAAGVNTEETSVVPEKPTWSVHELLASYPRPTISPATLIKLHELSALLPPEEGTEAHERMRRELEELVRLVEAVKLVDTSDVDAVGDEGFVQGIPDGRVWPDDQGMVLSSNTREVEFEDKDGESGTELLKHAAVTKNGLYVVEADRRRKRE